MRILLFLLFLFVSPAFAQNQFSFYSFLGTSTDVYTTAVSNNGNAWTTGGGSSPILVNCPTVFNYAGNRYLYLSDAVDSNLNQTTVHIGQLDSSNNIHLIWNYDFKSNIANAAAVFSGRILTDSAGLIHIFTPVDTSGGYTGFTIYEMHMINGVTGWSTPIAVTLSGGPVSNYDFSVYQVGSSFYGISTDFISGQGNGGFGASICSWSASSLLGPYTNVSCSSTGGSPLASLNSAAWEGPELYHNGSMTNWAIHSENINTGQRKEYGASCTGQLPTTCITGTMVAWTWDNQYRNGTIITNTPLIGAIQ